MKLCKDCKYVVNNTLIIENPPIYSYLCTNPRFSVVNVVDGSIPTVYCADCRSNKDQCSFTGKFWEKKNE